MANPFEEEVYHEMNVHYLNVTPLANEISYGDIATKLLSENLLLTALELHTELIEAGREVPKLKEFFSNPGNFEHQAVSRPEITSSIPRSSSQATLDSLDLTRYSEDGERGVDERVAVLEFELRKAKETISALRANLTVATESEATTPDAAGVLKFPHSESIKPHEQRALNFLLNEYLLLHGYKLTSITFADENENQDFEDWDDVGLNIAKPAELLILYRDFMRQTGHEKPPCQHASCQTDVLEKDLVEDAHLHSMVLQMEQLKDQLNILEQEKQEIKRMWTVENRLGMGDASNSTTPGTDMGDMTVENISMHSMTPDHFELIEVETKAVEEPPLLRSDDNSSAVSLADTDVEWTRLGLPSADTAPDSTNTPAKSSPEPMPDTASECILLSSPISRSLPAAFQREVMARCFVNTSRQQEGHLLEEILSEGISEERLVYILGQSLPRIIPNVILNKREEVIPLIICTIHLHPETSDRDRLLHLLFNLKKRPHEEERRIILAGIVGIARCSGLSMVENEILPQCWEQISHRHVERRLLVAESCSALAPYVSSSIRNSLMLSMLQQMLLEDKDETVREVVVRSLALIVTFMDDKDKYLQCEELAITAIEDPSPAVVNSATRILLPVIAKWALDMGRLQTHLITRLLLRLKVHSKATPSNSPVTHRKDQENDQRVANIVLVIHTLLPYLVVSVAAVEPVLRSVGENSPIADRQDFYRFCHDLTNPFVFYEGEFEISLILGAFDAILEQEWYEEWPELEWVFTQMLSALLDIVKEIDIKQELVVTSFIKLFRDVSVGFGKTLTRQKIKPLFMVHMKELEVALTSVGRGNSWPPLTFIPVYLVGVLATVEDGDAAMMLKQFLNVLPVCGAPLEALDVSVRGLCEDPMGQEPVLVALWEGVVHPRAEVRLVTAALFAATVGRVSESLVGSRVAPGLVTLANDPDIGVRTSTLPAFATLITNTSLKEVQDKVYLQLQSFWLDPAIWNNHSMLQQMVQTMGSIVTYCEMWFREEVILPQLAATAAFALQQQNQTRRLDLSIALIDAFSAAVYCSLTRQTISTALLPGLRYLEPITIQSLHMHQETVLAMIRGAESRIEVPRPNERSSSISLAMATANVGQGVEDMKQKVSKIFQNKPVMNRPPGLSNFQSIFRKK